MQRTLYKSNSCHIQNVNVSVTEISTTERLYNVYRLLEPTVFYTYTLLIY